VNPTKLAFASLLVVLLVGLAGYYAWRQVQTLRGLRGSENLPPEDRRYVRNQAWRRLVGCLLMALFAALLAGWFFLGLDARANELAQMGEAARAQAERPDMSPEQQRSLYFCMLYLIAALLVLLGMVCTAGFEFWAIRRFSLRHRRQIQADCRAMIERQVALLRSQRNGHQ
jgi:hypothetical protein